MKYRLLLLLLMSLLLLLGATVVVSYKNSLHEMEEILDGNMVTNGRALFSLIALELRDDAADELPVLLDRYVRLRRGEGDWLANSTGDGGSPEVYDQHFYLQLSDADGKIIFASSDTALIATDSIHSGFFKVAMSDDTWHVFGLRDAETGYYFFTAQSETVRRELSREFVIYMLAPFALGALFLLIAMWSAISYGLKPLERLTAEVDARDADLLSPIEQAHDVTELKPLVMALNGLFQRVASMLDNEKKFSADASHELRSPLAGIQANLDAAKSLVVNERQNIYLDNIQTCTVNAVKVTSGLLLLSKLGQADAQGEFDAEMIDATAAITTEIAHQKSLVAGKPPEIHLLQEGPVPVIRGSADLFSILIRNLLDNALKYGGDHPVEIKLSFKSELCIAIRDYGPGIPADQLDFVVERFFRVRGTKPGGAGLGLAIAKSIADYFDATLRIDNVAAGGLQVVLSVPVAREGRTAAKLVSV